MSLAGRITSLIVIVMTFGLALAGIGTLSIIRDAQQAEADRELDQAMRAFTSQEITRSDSPEQCDLAQRMPNTYYLGVADAAGQVLCDNKLPGPTNPDVSGVTLGTVAEQDGAFTLVSIDEQTRWRTLVAPSTVSSTGELLVSIVAVDMSSSESTTTTFTLVFAGFSMLAVVLGAALTRILAVSTLRGLRKTAAEAQRFADGDYDTRLTGEHPRTEVGSLQLSLNTMLDRIEAAIEQRDASVSQMRQFVGDASHELRTPLVAVRGYAELYRMGAISDPADVKNAMERIEGEAKRMARLVEDLLQLARLDERRPLDLQPLDLVPIVNDAASDTRVGTPDRRVTVVAIDADALGPPDGAEDPAPSSAVFTPPPLTPPAVVLGDDHALRQLLSNLIGNATRYTPEGTPIELGIGVSTRRHEAVVLVVDHGDGIPVELREQVFQRFFRADTSRARDTGGTGLGLAIVRGVVRAHSGRLDVVDTPGGGATFRFAIPLADEAAVMALSERLRPESFMTTTGSDPQARARSRS
ncbi:HAMP domain-containing sensor histidine kinase [Agrococcus sp. ARC_14]|uniref:sensor histidine kinase n=1 Tax=Agrococcus sp. ARC_14 TaxID=2919927 RepID=UPI001F056980|nr:HAMP domain-containing sensor histidine kinase [Agrococcus sp. ARC_14]MCH1884358.1 HAMP domain-containing histidine kinase [Agrococcus sp. ARC_14]